MTCGNGLAACVGPAVVVTVDGWFFAVRQELPTMATPARSARLRACARGCWTA
ncbi:hypothetical protein ACGFYY_03930 [Streptomyces sp. NPDC048331]|uniref:hypothetical protein n=1 Tax=Streptomyces sp. NPDC048331 TaxID=3365534 RepID=UPI00371156E6